MAQEKYHVQCKLVRTEEQSPMVTTAIYRTAYLPEKFAVVGKHIGIDDDPDISYTWEVLETFTRLPSSEVNDRSQDYKRTRKASDV